MTETVQPAITAHQWLMLCGGLVGTVAAVVLAWTIIRHWVRKDDD